MFEINYFQNIFCIISVARVITEIYIQQLIDQFLWIKIKDIIRKVMHLLIIKNLKLNLSQTSITFIEDLKIL